MAKSNNLHEAFWFASVVIPATTEIEATATTEAAVATEATVDEAEDALEAIKNMKLP